MERLKQLIEKLRGEVDSGAEQEQLMETVFEMTRTIMSPRKTPLSQNVVSNSTNAAVENKVPVNKIVEKESISQEQTDLAEKLSKQPIDSIRSALGINEKYIFIQTFFKGESNSFENMIAALDEASGYEEAKSILEDYLPGIPMSEEQVEVVEKFDYLLKRRFFSI